ncbi:MAG: hypothetical protein ACI4XR_01155 [Bacilli bacterium]
MLYYKNGDECIEKYQISFDEKIIQNLLEEIKFKCSRIVHVEYDDIFQVRVAQEMIGKCYFNDSYFKNIHMEKIGVREYNDFYSFPEDIYHYSYDIYYFPKIVYVINSLLNGNQSAIEKIFNPNIQDTFNYDEKINSLSIQIDNTPNIDLKTKFELLYKLENLINEKELNSKQINEKKYYDKLKSLIKLTLIDKLPLDVKEKYENFYENGSRLKRLRLK